MMPRIFCFVAFAKWILLATLALFLTKYSYSLQLKICKVTSLVCLFFFVIYANLELGSGADPTKLLNRPTLSILLYV